jgi:hypothetical protein
MRSARPSSTDDELRKRLVRQFVEEHAHGLGVADGNIEDVACVLEGECRASGVPDGYKLARELDRRLGWEVDTAMVETLDMLGTTISAGVREAVAEWVQRCQVAPRLAIGDAVNVRHRGDLHDGVIARVDLRAAEYVVRVPSLGHVESGSGTHGLVRPFEDFHDIVQPAEEFQLVGQDAPRARG